MLERLNLKSLLLLLSVLFVTLTLCAATYIETLQVNTINTPAGDAMVLQPSVNSNGSMITTGTGIVTLDSQGTGIVDIKAAGADVNVTATGNNVTLTGSDILLVDGSEGTVGHVWTATDTGGAADWQTIAPAILTVNPQTTTYTALTTDDIILVSGGIFDVDLYTAIGNEGRILTIKKTDSSLTNIITIDPNGAQTIGGVTTKTLNTNGETYRIVSDNANWIILDHKTLTAPADYTPATQGPTAGPTFDTAKFWRTGNAVNIMIRMTITTRDASELQIGLPGVLTIFTDDASDPVVLGLARANGASAAELSVLGTDGDAFVNFGIGQAITPQVANSVLAASASLTYTVEIPVNQWDN